MTARVYPDDSILLSNLSKNMYGNFTDFSVIMTKLFGRENRNSKVLLGSAKYSIHFSIFENPLVRFVSANRIPLQWIYIVPFYGNCSVQNSLTDN